MVRYSEYIAGEMTVARGEGNSWAAISRQYGVSPKTAKAWVRRWAVSHRPVR